MPGRHPGPGVRRFRLLLQQEGDGFDPAFSEDDDEDAPVHRSRWWRFGKVKKRALRRTMSTVPLLDSEDTDELTEAGTSMEASNSHSFSVLTCLES